MLNPSSFHAYLIKMIGGVKKKSTDACYINILYYFYSTIKTRKQKLNLKSKAMEDTKEINNQVATCTICGEPLNDESYPLCSHCRTKEFLNSYGYKPRPQFRGQRLKNAPSKRAFGVEIEVHPRRIDVAGGDEYLNAKIARGLTQEAFGDFAYLKEDGSLNRNGFEIVTHPATFRYLRTNRVFDVLDKLPISSFQHNDTGLHIHVSRAGLKDLQLCKLIYFFSNPLNNDYLVKVAQRDWNTYCRPVEKGKMKWMATATEQNGRANHYERYHAINLTNSTTVEFRMFKGNTKPDAIYRAIQFVDAMIEFTAKSAATKLHYENFIQFISDNGRRWNLLNTWNRTWKKSKLFNEVVAERRTSRATR